MSNLPIEFDENGDPYLAEEAEAVNRPAYGCGGDVAVDDLDPAEAFDDIAESVPDDVLEHLDEGPDAAEPATPTGDD